MGGPEPGFYMSSLQMTIYPAEPYPTCPAPDCGTTFDIAHNEPRTWYCSGCRCFYDGDLKAIVNKYASQARKRPASKSPVTAPVFDNGDFPEDFPPED